MPLCWLAEGDPIKSGKTPSPSPHPSPPQKKMTVGRVGRFMLVGRRIEGRGSRIDPGRVGSINEPLKND